MKAIENTFLAKGAIRGRILVPSQISLDWIGSELFTIVLIYGVTHDFAELCIGP